MDLCTCLLSSASLCQATAVSRYLLLYTYAFGQGNELELQALEKEHGHWGVMTDSISDLLILLCLFIQYSTFIHTVHTYQKPYLLLLRVEPCPKSDLVQELQDGVRYSSRYCIHNRVLDTSVCNGWYCFQRS